MHLLAPALTRGDDTIAAAWHAVAAGEIERYLPVHRASDAFRLVAHPAATEDAVVVYNRPDADYDARVLRFLEAAVRAGAAVFPVALAEDSLRPADVVSAAQSFDVPAQLRQRDLPISSREVLASVFGRAVVSKLRPTLCRDHLRLFLSYRRLDGECAAEAVDLMLRRRSETAFRDRIDVKSGEDAQEVIMERLRQSDVVVFLDTPRSGESDWIMRELEVAVGFQMPMVWVRFGPDTGRVPLRIQPGRTPHLRFDDVPASREELSAGVGDQIVDAAFGTMDEAALRVFSELTRLRALADRGEVQLREIDPANLVYTVSVPHRECTPFPYPHRPVTHVVQFFSRWPKGADEEMITPQLDRLASSFDAAVLLAPIPPQEIAPNHAKPVFVDSVEAYVSAAGRHMAPAHARDRAIILSGAYPDTAGVFEQHVTDALHAFVRTAFDRGLSVVFGNHPTFRPLILDVAGRHRPRDAKEAVRLYTSAYFTPPGEQATLSGLANTTVTADVGHDRERSLTEMRRVMIADTTAVALVVIGGKTDRPDLTPGVDEEIALARGRGLPVFLVGAAGGRAAQLAAAGAADGWTGSLNDLDPAMNDRLRVSFDFDYLAAEILESLGY